MSKERFVYLYTGRRPVLELFGARFEKGVAFVTAHRFTPSQEKDLVRYGVLGPTPSEDATTASAAPAPVVAPEETMARTTITITKKGGRIRGVR